jgi:signal transduction histidine kinase
MDVEQESEELLRQTRRLETACSIIQDVHSSLSLQAVIDVIVNNLVEIGGFIGAAISIDARVENLELHHTATAGTTTGDGYRETPIYIRGIEIGTLTTFHRGIDNDAQEELLEFLLPTLFMGIEHAASFAEVMDYRATLEHKVVERTAQLAAAHEQLAQSLDELREAKAARDRFFANINHEIRTPLTLIQLASDAMTRSDDALSDGARQKIEEINGSTRRLLHLVNSLLLLAAGDEGKLRVRPGPCDVAVVLQRLTRNWVTAAQKGEVDLRYAGPTQCPATMDEAALETVVGNFVSNAVKFTPKGGRITVTLAATENSVTISVRDTGPGIDPDFVPKLFGRFERSTTAVNTGVRGTGIGLSLSKELVELQGGSIDVIRHDDPTGTSFVCHIPRNQSVTAVVPQVANAMDAAVERAPRAKTKSQSSTVSGAPDATILLAEDDPGLSEHIARVLSEKYRVLTAPNGKVALEMAREHLPDLLVTDLEMPEMNGIELTRHFLALQGTALAPVLIVSAHAGLGERLAGFEAGAVDYVLKPFSADELLGRIRNQLALRKLALRLHETQKLAAMGMLSAGLAHELRNPANALVNALPPLVELLSPDQRVPDSPGALLTEVATEAVNQIRERCKSILDYSRPDRVHKEPVDIRQLLARTKRLLATALAGVEVREEIAIDEAVPCAAPLIEQVLINLLDNAAYAAKPGGWVSLSVRAEGPLVVIEIGDSGPGVPPSLKDRIFDPFFTTKPVGEGTGLGLTISRRIALNHGGELRVVAREHGTAFRLELPRHSESHS